MTDTLEAYGEDMQQEVDAEASRIERGEDGAVLQVMRRTQQSGDFRTIRLKQE